MPKILVADDNTNIQKMVSLAFSERGIEVVSVGNGEAAVRRLPDLIPDLVLADIFMPVRNGYEVCEYVKKDPRFSHIPVILLVGAFDPLDEKEAHRVGADGVLKKPFVPPDPLIAMVTSVLEKNPKLAAELVAARQSAAKPGEQSRPEARADKKLEMGKSAFVPTKAAAQISVPKVAPTEFPEPSPEEAGLVYGFGSGHRSIDPVAVPGDAQAPAAEDLEEFDGAATTSDWRRASRDFDIPEETAHGPAFAEDQANSPVFPLASSAPVEAAWTPAPIEKIQPVVKEAIAQTIDVALEPEPLELASAAAALAEAHAVEVPQASEELASPESVRAQETHEPEEIPFAVPAPEPVAQEEKAPVMAAAAEEVKAEVIHTPLVKAEVGPESTLTTKAAGWIESIFPAKYPKGGWFSALSGPKKEAAETAVPACDAAPGAHLQVEEAVPAPTAEPVAEIVTETNTAPMAEPVLAVDAVDEESFFAEEPVVAEPDTVTSATATEDLGASIEEPESMQQEPEPAVPMPVAAERNAPERPWSAPMRTIFADTDPGLIEPPAVRVVPEPLLVDENANAASSGYGGRLEQLPPAHSFLVPAEPTPEAETIVAKQVEMNGDREALQAQLVAEDSERIPTGPLPSREALSEIPFLSPPPEFHRAEVQSASGLDQEMVDAVVRKVLERLEPQLHEFLSKDLLKPIVENILQNGNRKTDR